MGMGDQLFVLIPERVAASYRRFVVRVRHWTKSFDASLVKVGVRPLRIQSATIQWDANDKLQVTDATLKTDFYPTVSTIEQGLAVEPAAGIWRVDGLTPVAVSHSGQETVTVTGECSTRVLVTDKKYSGDYANYEERNRQFHDWVYSHKWLMHPSPLDPLTSCYVLESSWREQLDCPMVVAPNQPPAPPPQNQIRYVFEDFLED